MERAGLSSARTKFLQPAGLDVVPGGARLLLAQHNRRGQFAAIVADNRMWLAAHGDDRVQFARHASTRQ